MNLLDGRAIRKGGQLLFDGGDFKAAIPNEKMGDGMEWKQIICGIRPEAINLCPSPQAVELSCKIELVEALGAETLTYYRSRAHRFVARFSASEAQKRGEDIMLYISQDQCHYFDSATGLAVAHP